MYVNIKLIMSWIFEYKLNLNANITILNELSESNTWQVAIFKVLNSAQKCEILMEF